jgi:uridine kinase
MSQLLQILSTAHPKLASTTLIAIDGHGGAGKSTLTALLSEQLEAEVIHTDDFSSWDNPLEWWRKLEPTIFDPIAAGAETLSYPRSTWVEGQLRPPVENQPVTEIMLLEGVTALRREFRPYISLGIFVDVPMDVAVERGAQRDLTYDTGKSEAEIRAEWEEWMQMEEQYFAEHQPKEYADSVLDGQRGFAGQV